MISVVLIPKSFWWPTISKELLLSARQNTPPKCLTSVLKLSVLKNTTTLPSLTCPLPHHVALIFCSQISLKVSNAIILSVLPALFPTSTQWNVLAILLPWYLSSQFSAHGHCSDLVVNYLR